MPFSLGFWAAAGAGGGAAAGAYELISTQILGTTATTLSFNSIPQTYKHLQIRYVAVTPANGDILTMRMNGITTSSYSRHGLEGPGSAFWSGGSNSLTSSYVMGSQIGMVTGEPYSGIVDILDYASTVKNKTFKSFNGVASSTNVSVALVSGALFSTSAVSSITLFTNGGTNLSAGSRFSLYGIKG